MMEPTNGTAIGDGTSPPIIKTTSTRTIVVFSGPQPGSGEALGGVLSALATAYHYKTRGEEISLAFQGPGSRWIGELQKPDHPAHDLFNEVKDLVVGERLYTTQ